MPIDTGMTANALLRAKRNVLNVCNQGGDITLFKPSVKDEMGSGLSNTTLTLKSFPTRYSPYDREIMQKISWAENTDILCYVAKQQLDDLSLTVQTLKAKYAKFKCNNKTYDVRYIELYSPFASDYLYVVIGGKA